MPYRVYDKVHDITDTKAFFTYCINCIQNVCFNTLFISTYKFKLEKNIMKKLAAASLAIASLAALNVKASPISAAEVEAAQRSWGEGIVKIGKAKDAKKAAIEHLDMFYAFNQGQVLFKPTLASVDQFRGTKKEALSYFIGQDLAEDKGFALAPYTKVRWENEGIITNGNSATAMGNYFFTKTNGEEVKAEYSFAYTKDGKGNLKINLHHSSLPFQR